MTVCVVILRGLAGEGRPHDPAVRSPQRLFRSLRKQRSLLLPGLPADQTMRQTQLQSSPLHGGMQHFDCGIGDFGPDPIAGQHADLELTLIRHPISSSLVPMHAAQGALKIFLAMILPGVALEYRERAFRTTAAGRSTR